MESSWILIALSILTFFLIGTWRRRGIPSLPLPPGPLSIPIVGSIILLRKSFADLEPVLRRLHSDHGPVVSLRIGHRPAVFVADRALAHRALVHNAAVFASRPPPTPVARAFKGGHYNISSSDYGSVWRAFRRNLTSEIFHPARVSAYAPARGWVLGVLTDRLKAAQAEAGVQAGVEVMGHFQYAMFCLLVLMCFGEKLDEPVIRDIERIQRTALLSFGRGRFNVLNFWPALTKILFRSRWRDLHRIRTDQEAVLIPLIESRICQNNAPAAVPCYVDTLLNLQLPTDHEIRKPRMGDIVNLCSEFLNAGTDTTSTALQWVMVNLVKYPEIQERVYAELKEAAGNRVEVFSEEEVGKLRYLRAVVMEALRRHPPGHFVLPHAVSEDTELGGYRIPKDGSVNFMVAEMGLDPAVWEDPMAFKPERFLRDDEEQIIHNMTKGSGDTIKMMPFGAGRRICPGSGLALLHLQYFVANLVWTFQWDVDANHPPDLAEKQEFTVVMKHPLRAHLTPRLPPSASA